MSSQELIARLEQARPQPILGPILECFLGARVVRPAVFTLRLTEIPPNIVWVRAVVGFPPDPTWMFPATFCLN